MGLRSRQRRLAGVSKEDAYDAESASIRTQSLEEHLRASVDDVDAFNLMWKSTVGYAGLVLAGYEAILLYQLLTGSSYTTRLPLCLGLKLVAFGSILSTREYVRAGRSQSLGRSLFFSGSYALIWLCCSALLHLSFSAVEVSPLCILYFLASLGVLRLIGNNTKAEVARAQQLEKLQRLVGGVGA
ncbi:Regulator of chromosome condensation [Phytophthora pseudosyringae]|uniref:Regulator of chromosome condensation n=1 Tax=Phytophthora pseudosyringae TaxID=221518 RepID=A0A8T1WMF5_9STRA|nr:Regulator of chromosome condensation [Phytophthora pseudosyringae]